MQKVLLKQWQHAQASRTAFESDSQLRGELKEQPAGQRKSPNWLSRIQDIHTVASNSRLAIMYWVPQLPTLSVAWTTS
jgi:hypothetical protein